MTNEIWPPKAYDQQIEHLRSMVGQLVYVVELNTTEINTGVKFTDKPLTLLAVVDYPQPDPYRQLCPHMLILDDGRGINVGRVARVSTGSAFQPAVEQILYVNYEYVQAVLEAPRSFSRAKLKATSTALLATVFGEQPGRLLAQAADDAALLAQTTLANK